MMDIVSPQYRLRCQLRGHEDDACGICVCGNAGIATSSRDRTVRFWTLDEPQKREYTMSKILLGHTSFVGPVAWVPPSEELPEGGIISGGMDSLVLVWNLATGEKVQTLKGNKLQVTGVALDDSDIVSVSVDCTLSRWRGGRQLEVWEGHKAPIQAIVKLPSGEFITGSSDMTLKLWKGKSCTHTFLGHTDTVRGVAVMPNVGILSASHDGSIRLWALSGELLLEMVGHTSIVYSVDAHTSGFIVSGSEDCSAKIWKDGVCVQNIEHPGFVWDAKFLGNGDIVTACSDGIVRVWTSSHERTADAIEFDSFFNQLFQYKISRKKVGEVKLEDLPGLDALKTPGSSDGQTKIVRERDNGVEEFGNTPTIEITGQWKWAEDKLLISAWLNVSIEPVVGSDKKAVAFWERILQYCEENNPGVIRRGVMAMKKRWSRLNEGAKKFGVCYEEAQRTVGSGSSMDDVNERAHTLHLAKFLKKSNFSMHWFALRREPKWRTPSTTESSKRTNFSRFGNYSSSGNNNTPSDTNCVESPVPPKGTKAAKRKGKEKSRSVEADEEYEELRSNKYRKLNLMQELYETKQLELQTRQKEIEAKQSEIDLQVILADTTKMTNAQRKAHSKMLEKILTKN